MAGFDFSNVVRLSFEDIMTPILFVIIYIIARFVYCIRKKQKTTLKKELLHVVFVGYIGAVFTLLITFHTSLSFGEGIFELESVYSGEERLNLIPFKTIAEQLNSDREMDYVNLLGNFLMMLPMPIFIKLHKPQYKNYTYLLIVFAVVITAETIQYFTGRSFDMDDIILNMVGASIGLCGFNTANKHIQKKREKRK